MIRRQGFAATSVDELCRAASVTKGAFFHHFGSKEGLGVAVAQYWNQTTTTIFAAAPYHAHQDPLDRVLAYLDFRSESIAGEIPEFTCLVGTMVQEVFASSPAIRKACAASIFGHAESLVPDIQRAMDASKMKVDWTADSLARHIQTVLQGAFVLSKAANEPEIARESIRHLRRHLELLFAVAKYPSQ